MTDVSATAATGMGTVTPGMIEALRTTRPWVRFLSILGFVGAAFILLGGILVMVLGTFSGAAASDPLGAGMMVGLGVIYMIGALLYIVAALHLSRYASAITRAVRHPVDVVSMEAALTHQKSFWKFTGIVAIVTMLLYIPGIVAAIAIPNLLTAMQRSKQKRTAADIRAIAVATEAWATDNNRYPEARTIDALAGMLEPTYIKTMPRVDGWGHPLHYAAVPNSYGEAGQSYVLASGGKDGVLDLQEPARYLEETSLSGTFDDDFAYSGGEWLQTPEGFD